jgi:hypothetical protein
MMVPSLSDTGAPRCRSSTTALVGGSSDTPAMPDSSIRTVGGLGPEAGIAVFVDASESPIADGR